MGQVKRQKGKKTTAPRSALGERVWAVISDHYVNFDMTYDVARAEAELKRLKKQPGVVVVTNTTAVRMVRNSDERNEPIPTDLRSLTSDL